MYTCMHDLGPATGRAHHTIMELKNTLYIGAGPGNIMVRVLVQVRRPTQYTLPHRLRRPGDLDDCQCLTL